MVLNQEAGGGGICKRAAAEWNKTKQDLKYAKIDQNQYASWNHIPHLNFFLEKMLVLNNPDLLHEGIVYV